MGLRIPGEGKPAWLFPSAATQEVPGQSPWGCLQEPSQSWVLLGTAVAPHLPPLCFTLPLPTVSHSHSLQDKVFLPFLLLSLGSSLGDAGAGLGVCESSSWCATRAWEVWLLALGTSGPLLKGIAYTAAL